MMEAMLKKSTVYVVLALLIGVATTALFADDGDEQSDARAQGGAVNIVVQGPRDVKPDGNYRDLVATEELFWYNASIPASPYPLNQIDIEWKIETELGTVVYAKGSILKYKYYQVGNYTINVSATLPDNSTGWKIIEVTVLLDYDGDGIADAWERHWFGSTAIADATTDYDKDGWSDLEEYENGTNPTAFTYKPGFFDQYWWLVVLIVAILVVVVLYLAVLRPKMEAKRKEEEQKKIAAAVEIEKTLLSFDEIDEKGKK